MGRLLTKLDNPHPAYRLDASDVGVTLIRNPGYEEEFNALARSLIDSPDDGIAVFPTPDGGCGYEQVFIIEM